MSTIQNLERVGLTKSELRGIAVSDLLDMVSDGFVRYTTQREGSETGLLREQQMERLWSCVLLHIREQLMRHPNLNKKQQKDAQEQYAEYFKRVGPARPHVRRRAD